MRTDEHLSEQPTLEVKISKHWKDIFQKYISSMYKDATLEFYGIKTPKIMELINVNLPVVEVRDSDIDQVFLLEDGTYLHLAFETGKHRDTQIRHLEYDVRLYARDRRKITTVIIYTKDVETAPPSLDIGIVDYSPKAVLMSKYDGDSICADLEAKLKSGHELTEKDILNLTFLPFMRNTLPPVDTVLNIVGMAKTITDESRRNVCIAATCAYANKALSESDMAKILEEVLKVNTLIDMAVRKGVQEGMSKGAETKAKEIARNFLKLGTPVKTVIECTGLDEATVVELKTETDQLNSLVQSA